MKNFVSVFLRFFLLDTLQIVLVRGIQCFNRSVILKHLFYSCHHPALSYCPLSQDNFSEHFDFLRVIYFIEKFVVLTLILCFVWSPLKLQLLICLIILRESYARTTPVMTAFYTFFVMDVIHRIISDNQSRCNKLHL